MKESEINLLSPEAPLKDTRSLYRRPWFISMALLAILWFTVPLLIKLFVPEPTPSGFTERSGVTRTNAPVLADVVTTDDPVIGPSTAPITIVEFGDFQCEFCREAAPIMRELRARYPEAIRVQFRDFPLTDVHPQALAAAEAAQCATLQGKFWQYHDALFAVGGDLTETQFVAIAQSVGLNTEDFSKCRESHRTLPGIQRDFEAGVAVGVSGTPTWFINGRKIEGVVPLESWSQVVLAVLRTTLSQ